MVFNFTKTERRLYDVLSDGKPHRLNELHECLNGEQSAVYQQMSNMRKKLRPRGLDIVVVNIRRRNFYQIIRPLYSSE